jgi:hypothetical protein
VREAVKEYEESVAMESAINLVFSMKAAELNIG